MFRKLLVLLMTLSFAIIMVACGRSNTNQFTNVNQPNNLAQNLTDGQYLVQQATYNDVNGEYSLFLLNSNPPVVRTKDVMMARLTDTEVSQGKKTYLQVTSGKTSLHLSEDFKIQYIHAVTETQTNPQTGQREVVVVRQESSFWTPFAGALAGQMVGNMLFTPQYYIPPVYHPGVTLSGYGGYGNTYNQAVGQYQNRYQTPPPAAVVQNARLRTTGQLNKSNSSPEVSKPSSTSSTNSRSTGSGYGSSNLKSNNQFSQRKSSSSSFGSKRSAPNRRAFGSRRRR